MADKKITELSELTALSQDDLFVVVDDPNGTPVTKRITAANVLGGFSYVVNSAAATDSVGLKALVTSNVNATASATVRAGEFIVNATSTSGNVAYQYGIVTKSVLAANTANVKVEHAAAKVTLDVGNAGALISNTYGLLIEVANTGGVRTTNVRSFITLADLAANSTTAQTLYLFDIGRNGTANVSFSSTNSNSTVMVTASNCAAFNANTQPTHKVKVNINGTNYWLLASDNAN